jgi:elongation factor Ts
MEKIKQLRDKTGAGISDCKNALEEAGGDIEKAIEILRKKGIAKAAKRGDREACEGIIKVAVNDAGNEGYIVEVNSETDFVARNEKFQQFVDKVLDVIRTKKPSNLDELMSSDMGDGTIKENLDNLSGTIGEKLDIKRFEVLSSSGTVAAYSHMAGRIGVLVALDKSDEADLARDIAMQIAAANPRYITPEDVPSEEINKEKEIYREQLLKEGKPENIIEKILEGKINKYFEEVCLIKQEYIKDDKKRVQDILGGTRVERFVRYSL